MDCANEQMKLVFLMDATGSMSRFLTSLKESLTQILPMVNILKPASNTNIEVVVGWYRDYCDPKVFEFCESSEPSKIMDFVSKLGATGGGDTPEAVKTGLNEVLKMKTPSTKIVVFHFADAYPHSSAHKDSRSTNSDLEKKMLTKSPAGYDWMNICKAFKDAEIPVYTFHNYATTRLVTGFFATLGELIALKQYCNSSDITETTIKVLMMLMDQPIPNFNLNESNELNGLTLIKFKNPPDFDILSEVNHSGYLGDYIARKSQETILLRAEVETSSLSPINELKADMRVLPKLFKTDETFRNSVYEFLNDMFTPSNVIAITYNNIIGELWRLVCRMRDDERRVSLMDKLGNTVQNLKEHDKKIVQAFIEASYNQLSEIKEDFIDPALKTCETIENPMVFVLQNNNGFDNFPSKSDIRDLNRAPTKETLTSLQRLLSNVYLTPLNNINSPHTTNEDTDMYEVAFLPECMWDGKLFKVIPHLVHQGSLFSQRASAIVAILCVLSKNTILYDRASNYLKSIRGKWIHLEDVQKYPEMLCLEYVRLLYKISQLEDGNEYLTKKETIAYKSLYRMNRYRLMTGVVLEVTLPYNPVVKDIRRDHRTKCSKCKFYRSYTLMTRSNEGELICGLCLWEEPKNDSAPRDLDEDPYNSHLAQCRNSECNAIYEVIRLDELGCTPKCHFCREGKQAPVINCVKCLNKFVNPLKDLSSTSTDYVCGQCEHNSQDSLITCRVNFVDFVKRNPDILKILGLEYENFEIIISNASMFKVFTNNFAEMVAQHPPIDPMNVTRLIWNNKLAHTPVSIATKILDIANNDILEATCYLCFEDKALPTLVDACGHCTNQACKKCLTEWYGQTSPGKLVLPTHLQCPFCKQSPNSKTLKSFNKRVCTLAKSVLKLNPKIYYGWCENCNHIKEHIEIVCAQYDVPTLSHFVCEDCNYTDVSVDDAKSCPGCGISTTKISGCNHITCTINGCDTHWCWECGDEFNEHDIYDHMYEEHGGMGVEY